MLTFRAIHEMVENLHNFSDDQIRVIAFKMSPQEREKLVDAYKDKLEEIKLQQKDNSYKMNVLKHALSL